MKTAYFWEYKIDINAIIANFVCLWKMSFHQAARLSPTSRPVLAFTAEGIFFRSTAIVPVKAENGSIIRGFS